MLIPKLLDFADVPSFHILHIALPHSFSSAHSHSSSGFTTQTLTNTHTHTHTHTHTPPQSFLSCYISVSHSLFPPGSNTHTHTYTHTHKTNTHMGCST